MLGRLFGLPPIVYFILAPIFAALGIAGMVYENGRDAERTAALSHAAPDPVELQDVTSGDTGNDFNEIVIAGQADVDNMIELTSSRRGRTRSRELFIALYPTDAEELSGPVAAVLEIDGVVSDEQLDAMYVGDGPAGPVLLADGVLSAGANSDVKKAFEGRKTVADTVYTIRPFMEGREEGLKPTGMGVVILMIGLVLAAAVGGYGYFRKRRQDAETARNEAEYAEIS